MRDELVIEFCRLQPEYFGFFEATSAATLSANPSLPGSTPMSAITASRTPIEIVPIGPPGSFSQSSR